MLTIQLTILLNENAVIINTGDTLAENTAEIIHFIAE